MIFGYVRKAKNEDLGESLEKQKQELLKLNDKVDYIFEEYANGLDVNRPQLNKMLETVTDGDTIVVTDISRLTRNIKQLNDIVEFAKKRNIKLQFGTTIWDNTDSMYI